MNNFTLKAKLFSLVGVALAALLIVGAVGWTGISKLGASVDEVGKVRLPSVLGLEMINEGHASVLSFDRLAAFYENDYKAQNEYANVLKLREEKWKQVDKGWKIYEPLPQTKEEEVLWKEFVKEREDWKAAEAKVADNIAALSRNRSEAEQKALFVEYYKLNAAAQPFYDKADSTLEKIVDLNVKVADEAVVDGEKATALSRTLMLGGSLAMLTILLLLGVWITRSILAQMGGEPAYVAEVVQRVADGDLTVQVQTNSGGISISCGAHQSPRNQPCGSSLTTMPLASVRDPRYRTQCFMAS